MYLFETMIWNSRAVEMFFLIEFGSFSKLIDTVNDFELRLPFCFALHILVCFFLFKKCFFFPSYTNGIL